MSQAEAIGYTRADLERIPKEAIMGLGCGNPTAAASLKKGEIVLDLGSGAGIDAFIAASKVGPKGRVIGVDMTREMVDRAMRLAKANGYGNIDFRLGDIEDLPVDSGSVDVIISNCVVNLSIDKGKVFREAYRVLRPGGRLVISDIVSEKSVPAKLRNDLDAWSDCIAGALEKDKYLGKLAEAGFDRIEIMDKNEFCVEFDSDKKQHRFMSITIKAHKPRTRRITRTVRGEAA